MERESGPWGWQSTGQVKRDVRYKIPPATFLELERNRKELSQYDLGAVVTRPDSYDAIGRFRLDDSYAADLLCTSGQPVVAGCVRPVAKTKCQVF